MKTHMIRRIVATALLLLAGCGSTSTSSEQAESSPATETSTAVEDVPTPAVAIDEESPVESMLGIPIFDDDAMNKWFEELDVERRRVTAECMIENGFEYSVEAPSQATQLTTDLARSSREFAVEHGYGIVAAFNAAEYDPDTDYGTTNSRYVASLTEPETDAYNIALFGASTDQELADSDSTFGVEGCMGQGLEEVFSVFSVLDSLEPVANGYYEQILADSRSVALYDNWSLCMAQAGFTFALPDDALESFYPRLDALLLNPDAYQEVEMSEDAQRGELIDFAGDSFGAHPKLTEQAQVQLDQLQADELATAVASWDCYEPLREEELAIQREYEAKFVEEVGPQVAAAQSDN